MQHYFKKDYSEKDYLDTEKPNANLIFLKQKYDEADDIFDRRFEKREEDGNSGSSLKPDLLKSKRVNELKELISEVNRRISKDDIESTKMASLVLGNAYLRLARCQHEIFGESQIYYSKANSYLEGYVGYACQDEVDLLIMLNKGKYFRNTAEAGKKSDYTRAYSIFKNVVGNIKCIEMDNEKKLHLLLDAKANMGRVKRYGYDLTDAQEIFLSIIRTLESCIEDAITKEFDNSDILKSLLEKANQDEDIEPYLAGVNENSAPQYILEYVLQSLIHIGTIFRKKKEYGNAIKIFELIKKIDRKGEEENIDACNNLGVCYRKLGDDQDRMTAAGRENYKHAEEIFTSLSKRGNKFASINYYKCKLIYDGPELDNVIEQLEEEEGLANSYHLQFLLGRLYEKKEDYKEAVKKFENIVNNKPYIARGSLGFKVYYNLARCKICNNQFREARNILSHIRNMLKKNQNYVDVLTENAYGWCLMKEGNYRQAIRVYRDFLAQENISIRPTHKAKIVNNLADCYIHLKKWDQAEKCIDYILKSEEGQNNMMAKYLQGVLLLDQALLTGAYDFNTVHQIFGKLTDKKSSEHGMNSGWLISALLSYNRSQDEALKKNIIQIVTCSSDYFSLKSYFHLAEFILQLLEKDRKNHEEELDISSLCRNFCRIKVNRHGENQAFEFLMNDMDFHNIQREDRAFILAHLALMYKYILDIKRSCLFTYKDLEDKENSEKAGSLPYHYTKLSTLKCLLADQKTQEPKLRLWNSIYMNDTHEGRVFDKLILEVAKSNNDMEMKKLLENYIGASITSPMQADSNVYMVSFSTAIDSFQMWSIYGDNERGAAIKFDEDFFDIKDDYYDPIMDTEIGKYSLYKVIYQDEDELKRDETKMEAFRSICAHICDIERRLNSLQQRESSNNGPLTSAIEKIRAFIVDCLNEIRFLFKSSSYEYEQELRLIQCSHNPNIDDKNFTIPRLYIDVDKKIENLTVKLGSKLENQQIKELSVWLKNTKKVKNVEISNLNTTILPTLHDNNVS